MPSDQMARYEFKKALEEIRGVRGSATQLVSLYIPPGTQISDVANQIRSEIGQAANIKSKSTNKNVTAALESVLQRLKHYRQIPGNGLVILCGHKAVAGGQTEMVQKVIEPPEAVPSYIYRCDSEFLLEPLERMLDEHENYGLLLVDRREATIGLLRGQRIELLRNMQSLVPSKHTMGGQSQKRFERLIEQAAHEFFKQVAESANEIFLNVKELKGILVGGPGYTKTHFVNSNYLHHEIQKKVIDTFDAGYTDEFGLKELVQNAHSTLEELGLTKQKDLMQRFLREVGKPDGGLAAYGEAQVRHALEMGAVATLILSDKLQKVTYGVRCKDCGHEEDRTLTGESAQREATARCGKCESANLHLTAKTDIIEELNAVAESRGTDVQLIGTDSDEGQLLLSAFGGVAAILRFKIGPPSTA
ncbi:MAG: peptide chain release factor aRF-1 [Methanobacteriota archaeon]